MSEILVLFSQTPVSAAKARGQYNSNNSVCVYIYIYTHTLLLLLYWPRAFAADTGVCENNTKISDIIPGVLKLSEH